MTEDASRRPPEPAGGPQRITEEGLELIKVFESLVLAPYHDDVGYPTVGYGHLLSKKKWADLSQWETLTETDANALLRKDVGRFERAVRRLITVPLTPGQFSAIVSFAFNLCAGNLQASTMRRKLNRGEYHDTPKELMRWVRAGGRKLRGLVRRRKAEALLGALWES